jgi:molybdopterin-synthase adenylyltransferase
MTTVRSQTGRKSAVRAQLKSVAWARDGDDLRVVYDRRSQLIIGDPSGQVERLLELLRTGGRTHDQLAIELSVHTDEVEAAIELLDAHGIVEDGARRTGLSAADQLRHASNLGFFESFASLARSREDMQRTLINAHVLVLGAGGLSCTVIQHLCGLGVGRLTIVDRDVVEGRNLARQFLYRHGDVGTAKVLRAAEWVREFDPSIEVTAIEEDLQSLDRVADLLARHRPDAVCAGVDTPHEIDAWVNAACVAAQVPFVRAGIWVTQGLVWSVDPGRSACSGCHQHGGPDDEELTEQLAGIRLFARTGGGNRAIGPVTGLLGSLAAFELLRFLTRFEEPAYAGACLELDFAAGCTSRLDGPWPKNPDCQVCGPVERSPSPVPATNPTGKEVTSHEA